MNTNLPLVPQTSDGPTWFNGWAAIGAHLDMIAKQYKNGKKRVWKGAKTGLERGKKRVGTGKKRVGTGKKNGLGTGAETGFKRGKNGISPISTIWNGVERPFFAVPHLSTVFFAVPALFSPFLDDFLPKTGKKGRQKMEERERKERVPFQFLSCSRFFPFLSTHISSIGCIQGWHRSPFAEFGGIADRMTPRMPYK